MACKKKEEEEEKETRKDHEATAKAFLGISGNHYHDTDGTRLYH